MKKKYINPLFTVIDIQISKVLAGSLDVNSGNTNQMLSKEGLSCFEDDEDFIGNE